jgi:hypothetical protein
MVYKPKKAQAEIIVTILIILLVLAAIVIVWQVVQNTIVKGSGEIPGQTECFTTKLNIIAANSSNVILNRGVGKGSLIGAAMIVDGSRVGTISFVGANNLTELEQKKYDVSLASKTGKYLKIAKLIGDNVDNARICDYTDNSIGDGVLIIA